jgi:hypothetical protein
MKKTTIFIFLLTLLTASLFAQKQVLKAVNSARIYAKPQAVSALTRATTLEPLENTFTATNTAVQFVADAAVLSQIERTKPQLLEFSMPISATNTMVLELIPMDIFGDKFKVMDAQNQTVNVWEGVFYKGVIKGDDNSVVSLSLSNGGTHIPPTTTATPLSISSILTTVLTLYTDGSARSWGGSRVGDIDIGAYDSEPLSNATVTPPVGTTKYYVVVRNAEGEYKTGEVTINVSAEPATPTVQATVAICNNDNTSITATSVGNTIKWYDATGTNALFTGATFTTPNLIANTAYKVRSQGGGC